MDLFEKCHTFVAGLSPQRIVNMIVDNGSSYTVTFEGIGWFSTARQTVTPDLVGQRFVLNRELAPLQHRYWFWRLHRRRYSIRRCRSRGTTPVPAIAHRAR